MSSDDKYSGIAAFDGKEEDFPEFEIKLMSFFKTKNLEDYATEDLDIKPKAIAKKGKGKSGTDLEVWEDYQGDKTALGYLTRYLKGSPLLLIKDCATTYEAWGILVKKYSVGNEDFDFDDLKDKRNDCKLTIDKDPDVWFKELEVLNLKLNEIDPKYMEDGREIIARVNRQMCDEYEGVVKSFKEGKRMMTSVTSHEDLFKMLKNMITDHWQSKVRGKKGGKISGLNFHMGKEEKMRNPNIECRSCGKKGHISKNCWAKNGKPSFNKKYEKRSGSGAFECWNCGEEGHSKKDCPKPKKNNNESNRNDSGGINGLFINAMWCEEIEPVEEEIDNEDEEAEMSINAVEKMDYKKALNKKKESAVLEFLGDTGAQMHCMMSDPGTLRNEKKVTTSASFGNASKTKIEKKGDLNTMTEKGMGVELKQIHIIPGCGRNIISLTQMQKEGWDYFTKGGKLFLSRGKETIELEEKEENLHYLKLRIVSDDEMKVFATKFDEKQAAMVSEDENEEDEDDDVGMPELVNRDAESDSDSSDDEEEEYERKEKPIARKKTITWSKEKPKTVCKMSVEEAHDKFGHHNIRRCKEMAKVLGVQLVGDDLKCDACALINSKQRAVSKTTNKKATRIGERLFIDTSGPFPEGINSSKYIFGAVDDFSGKMLYAFGSSKNKMVDFVSFSFDHFKGIEKPVMYVRLDNAGEHEVLRELCRKHGTKMEYIPSGTSQLNGRIERRFPVAWNKAKIFMQNAALTEKAKEKLWPKAMGTAILLGDMGPTSRSKVSAEELFTGKPPKLKPKDMIEWGRVGMVSNKAKIKAKMPPKGTPMVFVGYAMDHPSGTYEMYNPATNRIVTTDSVDFASFKRWVATESLTQLFEEDEGGSTDIEDDEEDKTKETPNPAIKMSRTDGKTMHTSSLVTNHRYNTRSRVTATDAESGGNDTTGDTKLGGNDAPTAVHREGDYKITGDTTVTPLVPQEPGEAGINFMKLGGNDSEMDDFLNLIFNVSVNSDPGDPQDIWEAINDDEIGQLWKMSATAECNNFLKRDSWKLIKKSDVPKGRKVIPCKEVFKRKDEIDGTIRLKTRIVTKGFMQIPGVDYTEKFAPTVTDEGQRTIFALILYLKDEDEDEENPYTIDNCDIEAAFLEPRLEKPMYIKPPDSLAACGFITKEDLNEYAIELWGSMYGNVDAALLWFREFVKYLKEVGMMQSQVDPCIFYLKEEGSMKPKVLVDVTVDDCAVGGKQSNVDWFMDELEKRFKITRGGRLKKHLGIDYEWIKDENGRTAIKATMDKRVKDIVKSYEAEAGKVAKEVPSPCFPSKVLSKNEGESINTEGYRSVVGKAMFFSTKLGYKTSSATRQLAGHLSNPGEEHWDALGRLVGYLKQMKLPGMIYKKPNELRVVSCEDTDFANCTETRRSVGSDVQTIGGTLVGWEVGRQDGVGTSTTDVEYRQLAKGCGNANFLMMLLREIAWVDYPAILFEDNMSAIYISKNKQVGKRTKHIDVKYHYTREFIEKDEELGCAKGTIAKIHTDDNTADIGTKSVSVKTFKRHEEDLDNGLPKLRKLLYEDGGVVSQSLSGGMSGHGNIGQQEKVISG